MTWLTSLGRYYILMTRTFSKPEKFSIYRKQIIKEIENVGLGSLGIVAIISLFMGAVITIQSAFGFESPWIPLYAVGVASRDSIILEFSPTIVSLILAGKVGGNIASEIGTMRVTEQIDALEIMGVNPSGYLILPKIIAAVFINPFLIIISMFLGLFGGYVAGIFTHAVTSYEYIYGIQYDFRPFNVSYALIKTVVFAFIITSVSSYHGYYTQGGALEVGRSSTKAVVYSSIIILLFNVLITQILLS
ncbi:MAG: ABC transporter permease [Bacteroidetes bacterium]|jgi:phospholipid/cholesterol/gamma-HCH transport system permease protein|nr:ABC transporter permease [Bacteroidota bacterium]MBK9673389.1 ABC transporter permease [Bacteroidota bacterium]MBK9800599.1 ABC transporter permease [Bacteroidota bacterium]MBP6411962.1 ABC transporter permease [Bacteroidia bacterium]